MNWLAHIVKYVLYVFNIIFVICGILLIILGALIIRNIGIFSQISYAFSSNTIPILIIVLGCIIIVTSFFGCCGAIREDLCCTITYAIFMFIAFCLQVALVVWIFVKRTDFLNTMDSFVNEAWSKNNEANGYPMDILQIGFKCCGVKGFIDYTDNGFLVPRSCCGSTIQICEPTEYLTKPGCRQEFNSFWASNTNIIRYAGIGVAIVELVAHTLACFLASNIRKSHHSK